MAINQSDEQGNVARQFFPLPLEINRISFFSLSWTLVHGLNEKSPLSGFTDDDLRAGKADFLVLIKGTDEIDQQIMHARKSYTAEEVVWNAKFRPVMTKTITGAPYVQTRQIGEFEQLKVPEAAVQT